MTVDERPGLQAALDYMRPGDMLTVQEAGRLGRNLLEGLIVLNDLFQRGSPSRCWRASPPVSTPSVP